MSLNWNMKAVKDFDSIKDDNAINEVMIFATMIVGIPRITEKNAKEFYQRVNLMELINGAHLSRDGQPRYITQEDVDARIGLTTNASEFSRAELWRRIQKHHFVA